MRAKLGAGGVAVDTYAVRSTLVHRHAGVIEIVYALRGELEVRVSSERYVLEEGDFALLNAGDTHVFDGSHDNLTIVLQIQIDEFGDQFPELGDVVFTCESFDLPRYLGTEVYLRELLLGIFVASADTRVEKTAELIQELLNSYGIENYYDRRRALNQTRRSLSRRVMTLMRQYAAERNVLELISEEMHYSKGALSRIARESTGMSFSDLLMYMRLWKAEVLLLETNDTMVSVSSECGFSDVKYFTRAFRSWFGLTPSQYRKANRGRLLGGELIEKLATAPPELLTAHQQDPFPSGRPTRRSVTPIDVITGAAPIDTFLDASEIPTLDAVSGGSENLPHLFPIRVDEVGTGEAGWKYLLLHTDRTRYRPVIILPAQSGVPIAQFVQDLEESGIGDLTVWVSYRIGEEHTAEEISGVLRQALGIEVQPMLTG